MGGASNSFGHSVAGGVARGEAYYRDGRVEILDLDPSRVLAQVAGTEDYRTELTGRGEKIGGKCSCPAFVSAERTQWNYPADLLIDILSGRRCLTRPGRPCAHTAHPCASRNLAHIHQYREATSA